MPPSTPAETVAATFSCHRATVSPQKLVEAMIGEPTSKPICPGCGAEVPPDAPRAMPQMLFTLGTAEPDSVDGHRFSFSRSLAHQMGEGQG